MVGDETQIGFVQSMDGDIATVVMISQDGCSSCSMHSFCGTNDKCAEHYIKTDMDIKTGDKVILFIDPAKRIISALLLFLFPILLMITFYYIGASFFSENMAVASAIVGLAFSFVINRVIDKKWGKKISFIIASKYEEQD